MLPPLPVPAPLADINRVFEPVTLTAKPLKLTAPPLKLPPPAEAEIDPEALEAILKVPEPAASVKLPPCPALAVTDTLATAGRVIPPEPLFTIDIVPPLPPVVPEFAESTPVVPLVKLPILY